MNLTAVLTQRCNLLCEHCYLPAVLHKDGISDDLPKELFFQSVKSLGKQFADDVTELYLTGGEFLLLSYGKEVVKAVRDNFPSSTVYAYTNGLLFLKDDSLFEGVQPDVYHLGVDAWHGTVLPDGSCAVADRFLAEMESGGQFKLILHWTRQNDDDIIFNAFTRNYEGRGGLLIEDRSLNTTTGRAAKYRTPDYRKDEVWRPCDLADHVLVKYDGYCYCCHYSLRNTRIGRIDAPDLRERMLAMRHSAWGRVNRSSNSREFYDFVCRKWNIPFSPNRCLLCEKYVIWKGIDLDQAAEEFLSSRNGSH